MFCLQDLSPFRLTLFTPNAVINGHFAHSNFFLLLAAFTLYETTLKMILIIHESSNSAKAVYMCFVFGKGPCRSSPRYLAGDAVGVWGEGFPWSTAVL